ncbi:Aspartyl/glutamyl-tRNA(Asn/Gln) amidotransferase subunit B [Geobacillus sp. BCO2]|nr:Aspartyl/glutamyl-tRNA(Asn/Gln) amidotransferase subunit B [Geobacillus sp. BCO2]
MNFETVIGLEVHVELKTKSKIFSSSPNAFGAPPNTQTNVIDLGYPGVLPVLNRQAVEFAMKAAMALNCEIATETKFDRKTIFIRTTRKRTKFRNTTSRSAKTAGLKLK